MLEDLVKNLSFWFKYVGSFEHRKVSDIRGIDAVNSVHAFVRTDLFRCRVIFLTFGIFFNRRN